MLGSPNVSGFRRRVAGISLVGFAITVVAQELVAPHAKDDPASLYESMAAHADAARAANLLLLASAILLVPAVFGIVHLVRGRGVHLVHIGAALGVLGALGHTAIAIVNLIFVEMPRVGDRAAMLALLDRLNDSTAVIVVFPLILSFAFGMLLLSVALWRARVVPVWIPLCIVGGLALHFGAPEGFLVGRAAAIGLVGIAFAYIGLRVLWMSDAAWEQPTELASQSVEQSTESGSEASQRSDAGMPPARDPDPTAPTPSLPR